MKNIEIYEKLKNDSIKNEELYSCLISKNFNIVGAAIYRIIERKYCDDCIVKVLTQIALLLSGHKVIGPYQMGHLAIAALFLVEDKSALESFKQIFNNLKDDDKFFVDNFIKGMQEKNEK